MKYLGVPQSGSQANTTASRNRYGQYYRNRSIPVNPNSNAQAATRSLFGASATAWRALTTVQVDLWNSYAATMPKVDRLGTTVYWSGFQTFMECSMLKQSVGLALPTVPPADVTFPALELGVIIVDNSSNSVMIPFTPTPVPADTYILFDGTTAYSHGVSFAGPSEYRRLGYEIAAAASPSDMSAEYSAVWGGVGAPGLRVFFRARLLSATGCAGPWAFDRAIINA